jgi:hypothetical protein
MVEKESFKWEIMPYRRFTGPNFEQPRKPFA